jgi:carboxyl-terminal processing protease
LTTAYYFTPSGRSIQEKGITPDIEVRPAKIEEIEQAGWRHEADLKGALPNPNDAAKAGKTVPAAGGPGQPSSSAAPAAGTTEPTAAKPADAKGADAKPAATPATTQAAAQPKEPPVDYQLARAVDLLHGVAMFNARAVN